jgi:hypothetical protein
VNRTILGVIGTLVVLLGVGGLVAQSKKEAEPKSFLASGSFRAVVVPTDRPRTVIVTPCNAPAAGSADGARTPGATTIRLEGDTGLRTVLVPRCNAPEGTAVNGPANRPSAAFVLKAGDRPPPVPATPEDTGVQSQVVVPSASRAATVVVPPCRAGTKPVADSQRQVVVNPRGDSAVAPGC